MTDKRKSQLEIEVDASGAKRGFKEVEDASQQMGKAVAQSGQQAADGIDKIGTSAEKNAAKQERAYGRIESEIRRVTAAAQAAAEGTGRSGEILNKALSQGLDVSRIEPQLQKLRQLEASTKGIGVSAAQTSAALRNVPAQFTDIITSLQGGQAPMTVLLQQGGQLKDMFGGAGAAAKALGGYILSLVNPFTVSAAAIGALAVAYHQGTEESQAFARSLILSGNAAGTSINQLQAIRETVAASSGATQGAVAGALDQIVASGKVSAAVLGSVAEAAVLMEKTTGKAIGDTVKEFEDLGKAPVEASLKLNEQYRYLTAEIYAQIKALDDQGRAADAAALAQKAYADAVTSRAKDVANTLGTLETAWKGIVGAAKGAWDAMLGVGRESSIESQIAKVKERIAQGGGLFGTGVMGASVSDLKGQLTVLEAQLEAQKKSTAESAKSAASEQAKITWLKEGEKYLSKEAQMKRDIARVEEEGKAAGASRLEIEKRIASVREKYADKSSVAAVRKEVDELGKLLDRIAGKDLGVDGSFWKELDTLFKGYQSGKLSLDAYRDSVEKLIGQQKFATDAVAAAAKAEESYRREMEKSRHEIERYITGLEDRARVAEDELANYGKTKSEIEATTIARLEEQLAIASGFDSQAELVANLEREIAARQRARDAMQGIEAADAAKKAAEQSAKAWEKFTDDIERSLTDSLYRAFENGDDFGKAFAKSLENTFKTMALKFAVQMTVDAAGSAVGSLTGASGSSLGSTLNSASNVASLFGGAGAGASAASLVAANVAGAAGGDAIGTLIAGNAANWGVSAAGVSAGSSALGAIATAAPYVAAAAAVYSLLDGLGAFGGQREYTGAQNIVGTFSGSGFDGSIGRAWTKDGGWFHGDRSGTEYDAITGQLDGALDALAQSAAAQFRALADVFDDDTVGPAIEQFSFTLRRDVSSGLASAWEGIADDLYSGLAVAVFPSLAGLRQEGEAMAATFTRVVSETDAVSRVAQLMGTSIKDAFGNNNLNTILMLSDSLVQLAGGMEAFSAQFSAYYAAYYSAEEKTGQLRDDLTASFAAMQLELPQSKDQFREIAESLDLTTVSGQQTFAVMMKIAPQFAELADQIDATAQAAAEGAARLAAERQGWQNKLDLLTGAASERQQALQADLAATTDAATQALIRQVYAQEDLNAAADAAAQQAAAVAQQRAGLETALLQAQGNTAALRAQELAALDASNRALQEQIWALTDATAIAQQRAGLETQLLQMQGDTAALRERELASLDESNRALQQQIWALADAAEASRVAAAAAEEEARAKEAAAAEAERIASAIAQERLGLESQLLQLQGNTAELRARELAALNPANRALQEQIWLLEDQAAAAQKAAQAESERMGLQKQLWQLTGNTAALRAAELAALDPANRSLQEQIWLLQDQQAAASEWANTWRGITDGLREQARQLRGEIAGQSDYARLQAQFAIDTAAARSGDAAAAGRLSGLSADVLSSYTGQAASSLDVARLSASLAASLEATASVIESSAPRDATADEIRGLREEQRAQAATMARLLTSMEKIYGRWDRDGLPAERVEV